LFDERANRNAGDTPDQRNTRERLLDTNAGVYRDVVRPLYGQHLAR
jgi:phage baseplate assembly protein W